MLSVKRRSDAAWSFLSFLPMTSTSFLVSGISRQVLEGFADYVATEQGCQWLVRADGRFLELSFDCELCFRQAAAIQRGLKAMGATERGCVAGQTRPRVVLPSI